MKGIAVPSVRPDLMAKFMASLGHLSLEWKIYACLQDYTKAQVQAVIDGPFGDRIGGIIECGRSSVYLARLAVLRQHPDVEVWVSCDDDMEMLKTVGYDAMAEAALLPGVGIVSGNWAKNERALNRTYGDSFVKQPVVYTAGGMCFSRKIVEELLRSPLKPYLHDDPQFALTAYLAGYNNYRYLGSLIVHRIGSPDGVRRIFQLRDFVLPDPTYMIALPAAKVYEADNNYYIPSSKNLTPASHERHNKAREALGLPPKDALT